MNSCLFQISQSTDICCSISLTSHRKSLRDSQLLWSCPFWPILEPIRHTLLYTLSTSLKFSITMSFFCTFSFSHQFFNLNIFYPPEGCLHCTEIRFKQTKSVQIPPLREPVLSPFSSFPDLDVIGESWARLLTLLASNSPPRNLSISQPSQA